MIKSMRRGTIRISIDVINNSIKLMHKIFSKFTHVIIEDNFFTDQITYCGFNDDFREIKSGEIPPTYIVVCNDEGEVVFKEIK